MRNLSELLLLHNDLDELFFAHQTALLHFEFDRALAILEDYERELWTHIRDEEDILMPVYKERASQPRGAGFQLFLDDHHRMSEFVKLLKPEIEKLAADPAPEKQLIWLLDRESFFKKLCGHHDKRETDIFYPEMDRITTDEEKLALLDRVKWTPAAG
ncbi:MAG: hypothetical protein JSS81_04550 [Acidobacteria bacterium]|nr:hypothetical protein [Acidobacteriota bacterium]